MIINHEGSVFLDGVAFIGIYFVVVVVVVIVIFMREWENG